MTKYIWSKYDKRKFLNKHGEINKDGRVGSACFRDTQASLFYQTEMAMYKRGGLQLLSDKQQKTIKQIGLIKGLAKAKHCQKL